MATESKLDEKIAQLERQLREKELRLTRLRKQRRERDRKADTRRKIIAGALVLSHCEHDVDFHKQLYWLLDQFVDRPQDRALFGLPPRAETPEKKNDKETSDDSTRKPNG